MSVDLTLGPRPDESGPPIGGPESYPPDVVEQLDADAAGIIARYPQARSALLPLLASPPRTAPPSPLATRARSLAGKHHDAALTRPSSPSPIPL
jgi:hypothetical protein